MLALISKCQESAAHSYHLLLGCYTQECERTRIERLDFCIFNLKVSLHRFLFATEIQELQISLKIETYLKVIQQSRLRRLLCLFRI